MEWILAAVLFLVGCGIAYAAYESTSTYGEYPGFWWLGWGVATAGGLLAIVKMVGPLRDSYLLWSSGISFIAILLGGAIGRQDEEFSPPMWMGVGVLISNALLFILGRLGVPTTATVITLIVLAVITWGLGVMQRANGDSYYDMLYCTGHAAFIAAVFLMLGQLLTPLEKLNTVDVPNLITIHMAAESRIQSYGNALDQATQCKEVVKVEYDEDDPSFLVLIDERFSKANNLINTASKELRQSGIPTNVPFTGYNPEQSTLIAGMTEHANSAATNAQAAIDELSGVCGLYFEIARDYRRTILWTEIADWWQSEAYDFPTGQACYYGELVSITEADGTTQERIISDQGDLGGGMDWDSEGTNWKVFTYNDYVEFVNAGLIPVQEGLRTSPVDVAQYLCGPGGAFAEGEITIVKEHGSLRMEIEDEADTYVGNYRYGTWCVLDPASGRYAEITEDLQLPANAEWCWHQPNGGSTSNYYWRHWNGSSWEYRTGPRRCIYCSPNTWSGDTIVPDRRMSEFNRTDASVLGPNDMGGGPGTGK